MSEPFVCFSKNVTTETRWKKRVGWALKKNWGKDVFSNNLGPHLGFATLPQ